MEVKNTSPINRLSLNVLSVCCSFLNLTDHLTRFARVNKAMLAAAQTAGSWCNSDKDGYTRAMYQKLFKAPVNPLSALQRLVEKWNYKTRVVALHSLTPQEELDLLVKSFATTCTSVSITSRRPTVTDFMPLTRFPAVTHVVLNKEDPGQDCEIPYVARGQWSHGSRSEPVHVHGRQYPTKEAILEALVSAVPNLTSLDLTGVDWLPEGPEMENLTKLPKLRELALDCKDKWMAGLSKMTTLNTLYAGPDITSKGLAHLAASPLTDLTAFIHYDERLLEVATKQWPNLRKLSVCIDTYDEIPSTALKSLESLKHLQTLELITSDTAVREALRSIATLPQLTSLHFGGTSCLYPRDSLLDLTKGSSKSLTSLTLVRIMTETDTFQKLAEGLPALQFLSLLGCFHEVQKDKSRTEVKAQDLVDLTLPARVTLRVVAEAFVPRETYVEIEDTELEPEDYLEDAFDGLSYDSDEQDYMLFGHGGSDSDDNRSDD